MPEALGDDGARGLVESGGGAEGAAGNAGQPVEVLDGERSIEAEADAEGGEGLGCRALAQDGDGGVSGEEMRTGEDDGGKNDQRDQAIEHPAGEEGGTHAVSGFAAGRLRREPAASARISVVMARVGQSFT